MAFGQILEIVIEHLLSKKEEANLPAGALLSCQQSSRVALQCGKKLGLKTGAVSRVCRAYKQEITLKTPLPTFLASLELIFSRSKFLLYKFNVARKY